MSVNLAIGDALKGGSEVGSRVRIAAAACLVASGLFVGGAGGALAFAQPALDALGLDDDDAAKTESRQDEGTDPPPPADTGEKEPDEDKPGAGKPEDQKPDNGKPDDQEPDDQEPGDQKPENQDPGEDQEPVDVLPGDELPGDALPGGTEPSYGEGEPTNVPDPTKTPVPPPPDCDEKRGDGCEPGWPWWPWPWPWEPGEPPGPGGDGGVGGGFDPPAGRPDVPPAMQVPPHVGVEPDPYGPAVISAAPGVGIGAAELPLAPITLPIIVAPPAVLGGAGVAPRAPMEPIPPRGTKAEPAGRQSPPADFGSNVTMPAASYRVGYTDYLRTAGMSQVVALAAPGVAGMLVLTGAGGLVGYRQAKAGHAVRTGGSSRFVN